MNTADLLTGCIIAQSSYYGRNIGILLVNRRGGGTPTSGEEAKTYYLAIFIPELHDNERNWTERGPHVLLWIRQWDGNT